MPLLFAVVPVLSSLSRIKGNIVCKFYSAFSSGFFVAHPFFCLVLQGLTSRAFCQAGLPPLVGLRALSWLLSLLLFLLAI